MNLITSIYYNMEPLSFLLPGLFLLYYTRIDDRARIKVLVGYYLLGCLLMIKANMFNPLSDNINDYRLMCLLTSLAMSFFFYSCLEDRWQRWTIILFVVVHVGYYLGYYFMDNDPKAFDSLGYVLTSFSIVVMVFFFMYQTLRNVTDEPLSHNFDFWFVTAQMLYHCGSFIVFLTYGYFTKKIQTSNQYTLPNRYLLMQLWNGHNILLLISSLLICTSVVWISWRRKHP
jgi:heme/copper-type cytochrome/quinol oxidase subunit 4